MAPTRSSAASRLTTAAPLFAALGDKTRLHIVARLCGDGPMPIARLAKGAKVSRQAITKHLQVLEHAGIARGSRVGREYIWGLRTQWLPEAQRHLNQISHQWDAAIDRLRAMVEDQEN
jgi:DNA-binding transcriptional ArsR family regulator